MHAAIPLTLITFQPPLTLNPRQSLDAEGQRIGALIYRGLTRLDRNLVPRPDLAAGWTSDPSGRRWVFHLRPAQKDHAGQPIDAARMAVCLENYRAGKPRSPLMGSFPHWRATRAQGDAVALELDAPDPYLPRNLSLLRYFTVNGVPCAEPGPHDVVTASGPLRPAAWPAAWNLSPETALDLVPGVATPGLPAAARPWRFVFIRDDTTRLLALMHGDAAGGINPINITKTRWLQRTHPRDFDVYERESTEVQYLGFNLRDPMLGNRAVRRALIAAIPRQEIVDSKYEGMCKIADGLMLPELPESHPVPYTGPRGLEAAGRLLDAAGYPRGNDGVRFRLVYKTTPLREGNEIALMVQDVLRRLGVELTLEVVEPAVYFAQLRKGAFQLYSSRWVGIADGSIFHRILRTGERDNRVGYSNPEMDALLDRAIAEPSEPKRVALLARVQELMARDVPYFPLWNCDSTLVLRHEEAQASSITPSMLSLSGALDPLLGLR